MVWYKGHVRFNFYLIFFFLVLKCVTVKEMPKSTVINSNYAIRNFLLDLHQAVKALMSRCWTAGQLFVYATATIGEISHEPPL